MADSYLIDGYNLIHALGMLDRQYGAKALEHSRRRLLEFMNESLGDAASFATIVFDAQQAPRHVPHELTFHGLHILFATQEQSADDLIEILIDANKAPAELVVISNDSRLQQAARRHGSRAWSHGDLLDFVDRQKIAGRGGTPQASAGDDKDPVSHEEKAHWLKEFKPLESDPELREFFDLDRFDD